MIRNSVVVIPSLNPDEHLLEYVKGLIREGFHRILLIDDGSRMEAKDIFNRLSILPECEVLTHTVNMGKGRALKNAFNYYCQSYQKNYSGIITVDSDGQHMLEDVVKIDDKIREEPEALILGVRDFSLSSIPFKSKFGNMLTKYVLKIFVGGRISDTQTGLRGIPNSLISIYLTLFGERFEYETTMLIETINRHIVIQEIPIQTVYINDNRETHFHPIRDSFAIYRLIFFTFFKYTLVSLSSFLIDYIIFCLSLFMLGNFTLAVRVWIATTVARIFSSLYNYIVNRNVVFRDKGNKKNTLVKYYMLCIVQLCCSAMLVWLICGKIHYSEVFVKPIIDVVLFLISYQIQKNWIFREGAVCI